MSCILICSDWDRITRYDYMLFRKHLMWSDYPDVVLFYAAKEISLRKLIVDTRIVESNAEYKRKLAGVKLNGKPVSLTQAIDITTPNCFQEIQIGKTRIEIVVPGPTPWLETQKYRLLCLYKYLVILSTNKYNSIIYSPWWLRHIHNPIVRFRVRHQQVI